MYSIDDLLHLVNSDGADALRLHVGTPPVIVLEGKSCTLEGPPLCAEDAEQFLKQLANTRQRRELREHGTVRFVYRLRGCTDFLVYARREGEHIGIDIE